MSVEAKSPTTLFGYAVVIKLGEGAEISLPLNLTEDGMGVTVDVTLIP